jgi:TRAP-type uncharacterized transport system fused permease subunit
MKMLRWILFLPVSILFALFVSSFSMRLMLHSVGTYSVLIDLITPLTFCVLFFPISIKIVPKKRRETANWLRILLSIFSLYLFIDSKTFNHLFLTGNDFSHVWGLIGMLVGIFFSVIGITSEDYDDIE